MAATFVAGAAAASIAASSGSASAAAQSGSGYVNTFVAQYWYDIPGGAWNDCQNDAATANREEGRNPDGSVKYYCADAGGGNVNLWYRHLA